MQTNCIFPRNAKINIMGAASFFLKNKQINRSERKLKWRLCRDKRDGGGATRSKWKVCFYKLFLFLSFLNFSSFLLSLFSLFLFNCSFFCFPLNFLPFPCCRQSHQYLFTNLSRLRREWILRNVVENYFLKNTIPEFDQSPPQVIQAYNW